MSKASRRRSLADQRSDLFRGRGVALLLSQVGAQVSREWGERVKPLGLEVRSAMLFWHVARGEVRSQRELADALRLPESRIVGLVDELEQAGLIERRVHPKDRRSRQLHLTDEGRARLDKLMAIALDHEAAFADSLTVEERELLIDLLERIARRHELLSAAHPDF